MLIVDVFHFVHTLCDHVYTEAAFPGAIEDRGRSGFGVECLPIVPQPNNDPVGIRGGFRLYQLIRTSMIGTFNYVADRLVDRQQQLVRFLFGQKCASNPVTVFEHKVTHRPKFGKPAGHRDCIERHWFA